MIVTQLGFLGQPDPETRDELRTMATLMRVRAQQLIDTLTAALARTNVPAENVDALVARFNEVAALLDDFFLRVGAAGTDTELTALRLELPQIEDRVNALEADITVAIAAAQTTPPVEPPAEPPAEPVPAGVGTVGGLAIAALLIGGAFLVPRAVRAVFGDCPCQYGQSADREEQDLFFGT